MNELEAGSVSMSLEESPEIVSPVPATAQEPPQAQEPAPPAEEADPDGTIAGAGGVKFVPLGAVKAERERRQAAEKAAKDKDAEVASLKEKAAKYDEAADKIRAGLPIIDKIRNRPDILKLLEQPPAPVAEPAGPLTEQQAVKLAKALDLYTQDGKPDVARAQEVGAITQGVAQHETRQAVNPLLQTEATRQAQALYQHAVNKPVSESFKLDPRFLQETWNTVPPELIASNPGVAEIMRYVAIGRQVESGHKPIVAPPPALQTESIGGGAPQPAALSDTSERFRSAAGIARKDFTERREQFKPGQSNSLES